MKALVLLTANLRGTTQLAGDYLSTTPSSKAVRSSSPPLSTELRSNLTAKPLP